LIKEEKSPIIYGDGTQSRDFTFVENNVHANILACTAPKAVGQVINIACGARYTLIELVEKINKILNKNVEPIFDKKRAGDVKHSLASIEKANSILGYEVKVDFEEGLKRTIEFFANDF
jgi:UDP-glucose 4-epimerase